MKVAIAGKGGSGKTTVAGALIRHLAEQGQQVVAVDADPNPNLGVSLGVEAERVEGMESIFNALVASGYTHDQPMPDPDELIARYGIQAPGGVSLIATGKIERPMTGSCLCCGSHSTTRRFFGDLPAVDRIVVADLEAGLNDLIWAQPRAEDVVIVVAEPSAQSVEIASRAVHLAREMGVARVYAVANRCPSVADAERLAGTLGVQTILVPEDPAVSDADERGVATFDAHRMSPAMLAIGQLVEVVMSAPVSRSATSDPLPTLMPHIQNEGDV